MTSPIYISKKLEKLVANLVEKQPVESKSILGKWNANIFYVDRKKCWLITNSETKFSLIIKNMKNSNLKNLSELFTESLYSQLIYEGIIIDFNKLENLIGNIKLYPTDNDRKTIGTQNHNLEALDYWKYEFGSFENMPFRELTKRLNSSPTKVFNWKTPNEIMSEKLDTYA